MLIVLRSILKVEVAPKQDDPDLNPRLSGALAVHRMNFPLGHSVLWRLGCAQAA